MGWRQRNKILLEMMVTGSFGLGLKPDIGRKQATVGLSRVIYEKLSWVQESRGWFDGGVEDFRAEGESEIRSENGWRRFGCYVLVESFVFRRMDGSLLINFNFKNSHRIQCKCKGCLCLLSYILGSMVVCRSL